MRMCNVEGCGQRHYALGYCKAHYRRLYETGDVRAETPIRKYEWKTGDVCGRCEDIEWLADSGDSIDTIAARIITAAKPGTPAHRLRHQLRRHLRWHGRHDLIQRLEESR